MKYTKNQMDYIRKIRNAVRSVKGLLEKSEDYGFYQTNESTLPISERAFTKGYRLTNEEILASAPKRITKKTLESVSNKAVKSRLDFVVTEDVGKYGSGEIVTGLQSQFVKESYKKEKKKRKKETVYLDDNDYYTPSTTYEGTSHIDYDSGENVTSQRLVIDHFKEEIGSGALGSMVNGMLFDLETKIGTFELGNALRSADTNAFWGAMERHPHASKDGIDEFMQRVIDELPDSVFDAETKDALYALADGEEGI